MTKLTNQQIKELIKFGAVEFGKFWKTFALVALGVFALQFIGEYVISALVAVAMLGVVFGAWLAIVLMRKFCFANNIDWETFKRMDIT